MKSLRKNWPEEDSKVPPALLCRVELGLRLLQHLDPDQPAAGAWVLFGGYPFGQVAGIVTTPEKEWMVTCARHRLWTLRRRRSWIDHVATYRKLSAQVRAYSVPEDLGPAVLTGPGGAAKDRLTHYDRALTELPEFSRNALRPAEPGRHYFFRRGKPAWIEIPEDLTASHRPPVKHPVDEHSRLNGKPIEITRDDLKDAAKWLMGRERALPQIEPRNWLEHLGDVNFDVLEPNGSKYTERQSFTLDGLLNAVGIVGAGKSTLMVLIAVWAARNDPALRTTLVVGDVAEQLRLTAYLRDVLGLGAASPVIGFSTRGRHIQNLHRRLAAQGRATLIDHRTEVAFGDLSTACPIDALREDGTGEPTRLIDAPCTGLHPSDEGEADALDDLPALTKARGCPVWHDCPRNAAARTLVDAQVWIANMASLVTSPLSPHISDARLRHLELACVRSDIVVVDESDRVMMNLDDVFAPVATLVVKGPESWLDVLDIHNSRELSREGRLQLREEHVTQWEASLEVVTSVTNRLYRELIGHQDIREWAGIEFFNSWTLQERLLNEFLPRAEQSTPLLREEDLAIEDPDYDERGHARAAKATSPDGADRRARAEKVFDLFRDDPLGDSGSTDTEAAPLVAALWAVLHPLDHTVARRQVEAVFTSLFGDGASDLDVRKLEFLLLLSALHHRLDLLTLLWPEVEAALRLELTDNELVRRPPLDYMPLVPESPMGNLLGFQYIPDEVETEANRDHLTGTLRFFRCSGVGRQLLVTLSGLAADRAAGRSGPHVLLMSGTSWAGTSTRAHVPAPVGIILRPDPKRLQAVSKSTFTPRFLYNRGRPISLSGQPVAMRSAVLRLMVQQLGEERLGAPSVLDEELDQVEHSRRRALVLVGSYREAEIAAEQLHGIGRWKGHVRVLTADDADLDEAATGTRDAPDAAVGSIRRGNVATFAHDPHAIVLVAPLLAVERGHNILNQGKAAFGVVLFLSRPHPVPNDLGLAVFAINDWVSRFVDGTAEKPADPEEPASFRELVSRAGSLDAAGQAFRDLARHRWGKLLTRRYSYRQLSKSERRSFAWDQLVTMWQVIGRLVRGGVPARVVFVDAKFAPRMAEAHAPGAPSSAQPAFDTAATSLLVNMKEVLDPYFAASDADAELVRMLYAPVYHGLKQLFERDRQARALMARQMDGE
ncbi:pPIWI_RE_Z domain-containing protein [Amycolatopsis samaneae]|uniref:pPIWI-RE three-gene island domain-containing protein n=1 Tax=Amycolatopsis samaneae TaxID=664691 RepID=A0ABW5GXY0_9PSEU